MPRKKRDTTNPNPATEPAKDATQEQPPRTEPAAAAERSRRQGTPPTTEKPAQPGVEQKRYPASRGWAHDNDAGVQMMTYSSKDNKRYEVWLKFRDGKPSDQVRLFTKDNGFRWHGDAPEAGLYKGMGSWTHPVGYTTGAQDRLHGQRVYAEFVDLILKEKGIDRQVVDPSRFYNLLIENQRSYKSNPGEKALRRIQKALADAARENRQRYASVPYSRPTNHPLCV